MKLLFTILTFVIGGIIGFLYYKFVGCRSGTCPLTSNLWTSTIFGAIIGYLLLSSLVDKHFKKIENKDTIEIPNENKTDNRKR
ncbi:MAG: hypothetical protein DRZ79_00740 [Candidatus Cloacimonadota bacterium]|nr:MAG: hypothetical protein DRZ79_00740 [Candidatus Cloacimonadota bacterium]